MTMIDAHAQIGPRIIAEARDYPGFVEAIRKLIEKRKISLRTLDEVAGVPEGYSGKITTLPPIRGIGRVSMGALLGALSAKILLVEDSEAEAKLSSRMVKRDSRGRSRKKPADGGEL